MGAALPGNSRALWSAGPPEAFALPALLLLTTLSWVLVPWGTFQFDDFANVVRDPATTDVAALLERLPHGLRPLTRLSYFIDAQLFGMQAAGFLTTNLFLHVVTTALVFALARRRLAVLPSFLAALLFALQPANAEVVAYVSGRSTGLMAPLLLGGVLLHDQGRRVGAYALFALACLAKEIALVFPLLLLVWEATRDRAREVVAREVAMGEGVVRDVAMGERFARKGLLREVAIALVLATAIAIALLALDGYRSMLSWSFAFRSVGENLLANGRAIPTMLSLWVRPWALSADHDFDADGHVAVSVTGLALLAVVAGVAIALHRRRPLLALALLWPLIALLPTNSFIAKIDLVTEKPLYLAWVGPALALGAAAGSLLMVTATRSARLVVVAVVAAVLVAMASASWWRASLWRDPVALWTDAVSKAPQKSRCWNNLGMAHLVARDDAAAVAAFERALELDPANEAARLNLFTVRALCGEAC